MRLVRRRNQHIAAADIDFIFQAKRDRHRRESATKLSVVGHDRFHAAGAATRQHRDRVARFHDPGSNLAGIATEVQVRPHYILHGKTEFRKVAIARDVYRLKVVEQARTFKPRHVPALCDDVVAVEGADRDEVKIGRLQARGIVGEFRADLVEYLFVVVHQIHLVDSYDDVLNAEQGGDKSMPAGLPQYATARVHQDDREIRGRSAGRHVARVLLVPRRVGDDEFPLGRGEITVSDVDGDALFAFGAQAVGEQSQIERAGGAVHRRFGDRCELVFVNAVGIVQQPADQRALAIVYAARGRKAEEIRFLVLLYKCLDIARSDQRFRLDAQGLH